MTDAPDIAYIVSHTHWDREWYKPFRQFRVDLTRIVRRIMEALENDDEYGHFLLDGQAVVLEDYLAVCPEDEARISALVDAGSLSVGPWYILPDEFLVSAESTVRNLQLGHRVAGKFGKVQKVGYMPDSFGHIAQMPQLLRLAGIDSFIYSRGNGDEIERTGHEFFWRAPDGSEVLAVNQCKSYDNAAGLGLESYWEAHTQRATDASLAVERVRTLFGEMKSFSQGNIYLLNNGGDHIGPQRDFGEILAALREAFPKTEFIHSGLERYIQAVKEAGFVRNRHEGEMAQGRFHFILSGVWSARMYLKQLNDRAQRSLSLLAEPLGAYGRFCLGMQYPHGILEDAWKLLLQNHPHDSICGCSTDVVHREMVPRFEGVLQACEQTLRHEMTSLVPTFAKKSERDAETVICVANPLPRKRDALVERLVVLQNFGPDVDRLVLYDELGRTVGFEVVDVKCVRRFWGVDYRTELTAESQLEMLSTYLSEFGDGYLVDNPESEDHDCFLTIQFLAEGLPGVGHVLYYLRGEDTDPSDGRTSTGLGGESGSLGDAVTAFDDTLENEFCLVKLHPNGTFDLQCKTTGITYPGLNRLDDTEDIGDEYDYSQCAESRTVTTEGVEGKVRLLASTPYRAQLEAEFLFSLPESIARDRKVRSDRLVECPVRTVISLERGNPVVGVELVIDNRARDHRLRAAFPTSMETDTVLSDGHFFINQRPIDQPSGDGWMQRPQGTYPQQDYSQLQDGERGLAVLNMGLPEIEARRGEDGTPELYLTLLRSVGWLSRDDFETRSCSNAGPTLFTPDAQCLGAQRFQYGVVSYRGDHLDAGIKELSQRFRAPVLSCQGVVDSRIEGGRGLLEHSSSHTCVSAIKSHDTRDTLVVRLYNLSGQQTEDTLLFGADIVSAWRTDLLEARVTPLENRGPRELTVGLKPHEILSIEVDLGTASVKA